MNSVYFWGTRGSLPTAGNAAQVRAKIKQVLREVPAAGLGSEEAIEAFIDKLPFAVRGTYGGNTSCVELRGGDESVICDAGSGLRDLGAYLMRPDISIRKDAPHVFNIFLSHLHWDHIMGFPFFVPAFVPGNTIRIYSPHEDPEGTFVKQQSAPNFPVPLKAMGADISFHTLEPGKTHEIAGYSVRALRQNHPGDSYGYRFEQGGKALVYSTDAEHKLESEAETAAVVEFFRDADLVIFDSMYSLAEAISVKEDWGHSSNIVGVDLCHRARVRRYCMFHHEPVYDDEMLQRVLEETVRYEQLMREEHALEVLSAWDGLELEL